MINPQFDFNEKTVSLRDYTSVIVERDSGYFQYSYVYSAGGKVAGAWPNHPLPLSGVEIKERADLYLYYLSGSSCNVLEQ